MRVVCEIFPSLIHVCSIPVNTYHSDEIFQRGAGEILILTHGNQKEVTVPGVADAVAQHAVRAALVGLEEISL